MPESRMGSSPYLAVNFIQGSQNILYKRSLDGPLCWGLCGGFLAELAGVGVEVDITPQAARKFPRVHCPVDAVDCAVQLRKRQQGEGPARLTCPKGNISFDGIHLQQ